MYILHTESTESCQGVCVERRCSRERAVRWEDGRQAESRATGHHGPRLSSPVGDGRRSGGRPGGAGRTPRPAVSAESCGSGAVPPSCSRYTGRPPMSRELLRLTPGPHRTRQRCSGPVCDRPSASRPVPSRQNRLQRRLEAVLTGRNGPGRARTVTNRAGTALTGAVRTGRDTRRRHQTTARQWAARHGGRRRQTATRSDATVSQSPPPLVRRLLTIIRCWSGL